MWAVGTPGARVRIFKSIVVYMVDEKSGSGSGSGGHVQTMMMRVRDTIYGDTMTFGYFLGHAGVEKSGWIVGFDNKLFCFFRVEE